MNMAQRRCQICLIILGVIALLVLPTLAATTQIHVVKYANDHSTILAEQTLTYQQMRDTLPVEGDGITHYFLQGPVFVDDLNPTVQETLRWNSKEDTNVQEKDMGAVKGTNVKDLCNLVGGMAPGDTLVIKSSDGMTKEFAYKNIYTPPARQGPVVITWYCVDSTFSTCTGPYPDSGYSDGMRLVFFADTSVNPWGIHAFGNYDWHESADPTAWYYYQSGGEKYPTTTGLSVKYVSEVRIYSTKPAGGTTSASSGGGGGGGQVLPASGAAPPENPLLYGYRGKKLSSFSMATLNGTLRIFTSPNSTPSEVSTRVVNYLIPVDLPPAANVTLARLYLYISKSKGILTDHGVIPSLYVTLNGDRIEKDQEYVDTDGDDHKYVAATYAYDIRDRLKGNDTNIVSVRNMDHEQAVFTVDGVVLVTAYENKTGPVTRFWIDEGCDVISSLPKKGLFPGDCTTTFSFTGIVNMSLAQNASLYIVSTGYDRDNTTEHTVSFNNGTWINLFDRSGMGNITRLPAMKYLNETGNVLSIKSSIRTQDADYLVNRNAILVVTQQENGTSPPPLKVNSTGAAKAAQTPGAGVLSPTGNNTPRRRVTLETDPEGALVYLDGAYLGKITPHTIELDPGTRHTVRFELDGFVPAEMTIPAGNSTTIRTSMYAPVHSTKGRLTDDLRDPDGIRYGGLYVNSRPGGAIIFIDGVNTGRTAPSVIMGLKPGVHTIRVALDLRETNGKGGTEFAFEEQEVIVFPEVVIPVDINGIGYTPLHEMIVDSSQYRGTAFTVNGYPFNMTIPAQARAGYFDSFITLHNNNSFISYPLPITLDEDRYFQFKTRDAQNLRIAVDSDPHGAEVFIDGFRTGLFTPYKFGNISDGSHRILVWKPGYLPQQRLINLPRRSVPIPETSVDFTLEEYPNGFMYVDSVPEGADVSFDGLSTGEVTPALFKFLPTGAHSVTVTGRNVTKKFPDVTINALAFTNITVDLNGFPKD